ncbi:hypothetical protein Tco_0232965 [Tanacetum coccineum]
MENLDGNLPELSLHHFEQSLLGSVKMGKVVRIEDYPLPNGLKMPSHIGSYDGKGDPENFLHLFEGAIRMQKWLMPVSCHMFTYTLKDSARIWWNSQKADLQLTYKGLMEKTYTWVEAREVATNGVSNDRRDSFERPKKSSWNNNKGQMDKSWSFSYKGESHKLLSNLVKSPREILATERIEEVVKTGQLAHLVKGVTKKREKTSDTQSGEKNKEEKPSLEKTSILMVSRRDHGLKKRPASDNGMGEITFPPIPNEGSSDLVVIKLKPSIISLRVDSNTPLMGFSGEESWPLGEIPLEVIIGESPPMITKTLTFVIVKSDSPHNLLPGRTTMQEIGIIVSTVHGAIKFHTPNGVGTIFSEHNSQRSMEEEGNSANSGQGDAKDILSCIDTEEKIVINEEYLEQKVTIGRQLLTRVKMQLRDLLRAYADVFAWTTTQITGVPRTLIIREETFSTEHQLNVFNHTEQVKQKKRSTTLERNEVVRTQVEELVEAGVLREVKYQMWVSNPIIVKKDDGKWKLRIDFTNINKACTREPHPLPAAKLGAENLHKYRLKCFLDAYKGYHQITMAERTKKKQHSSQEKEFFAIEGYLSV